MNRRNFLRTSVAATAAAVTPLAQSNEQPRAHPPSSTTYDREKPMWLPGRIVFEPYQGKEQSIRMDIPMDIDVGPCDIMFTTRVDLRLTTMRELGTLYLEVDLGPAIRYIDSAISGRAPYWRRIMLREQDILREVVVVVQRTDSIFPCTTSQ